MLEKILSERCLLTKDKPLLVGVSGGPDSLCLLHILQEAGYPLVVAHFNHKLRPEADQEAETVGKIAGEMGLQIVVDSADVRGWAEREGYSIEEACRIQRYQFLFKTARAQATQAVAVGHTADDQVETVLMHFLRGAGLAGLKGMPFRLILPVFDESIPLVRPLLTMWRTETETYCTEHHLTPHLDSSNLDETYFRNHLRHSVIPALEKYNPRFKTALLRTAMSLQGDHDLLQRVVEEEWSRVVDSKGAGWIAFDQDMLAGCEPAMQRSLLRRAGETLRPVSRDIGYATVDRAVSFIQDDTRKQTDFIHGLFLIRENGKIILAAYEAEYDLGNLFRWSGEIIFTAGEEIAIGEDWILSSAVLSRDETDWEENDDPWTAWLDLEKTGPRFVVHTRQAGDVFQPLGMGGQSVKVREFFINQKIPRSRRDFWPIVSAEDAIAWIPGMRIAHPFRVTDTTSQVIRMTLKKVPAET
jgi:tRNA(Ile)-lysidine synthase